MQSAEGEHKTKQHITARTQVTKLQHCLKRFDFYYTHTMYLRGSYSTWTMTWTQYWTNLGGCMLSCYCHWCHCHYCSNWCCSPCDWHMHLANCLVATAGLEAHPCREGQVCNKEGHRAVNQSVLIFLWWMSIGACASSFRAGTHLPLVFHWHKCISPVGLYLTQRNKNITHLPALHADSPLWYATAERNRKTLNLDELSKRGSAKGRDKPWKNS